MLLVFMASRQQPSLLLKQILKLDKLFKATCMEMLLSVSVVGE